METNTAKLFRLLVVAEELRKALEDNTSPRRHAENLCATLANAYRNSLGAVNIGIRHQFTDNEIALMRSKVKIQAIKSYRERMGGASFGLKEAKDDVEAKMIELGLAYRDSNGCVLYYNT